MTTYRIYFFGERAISGRHDFEADNDQGAIQLAYLLSDACGDECLSFDLWRGDRHIAVPRLFVPKTFEELAAAHQERVVDTEERIARSNWQIARSRRLLESLESKRRDASPFGHAS